MHYFAGSLICAAMLLSAAILHGDELVQTPVFIAGQDGYNTYRIPSVIATREGTLLAFCEGRKNSSSDTGDIDVVLRRSNDGGKTWSPLQVVADDGANTIGNPCPVVDRNTGVIWLPLTRNSGTDNEGAIKAGTSKTSRSVWICESSDDGATWSKPVEITEQTKRPQWGWYATGPGVGIQLASGRLLIPCDHSVLMNRVYRSHVIYSDDAGKSWKLGGILGEKTNECQAVQLSDGRVMINMRSYHGKNRRAVAVSSDGGETFSEVRLDETLIEPVCQASLIRLDRQQAPKVVLLFSNPASTTRQKMTVRASTDDGASWAFARELHPGPAAYSSLVVLKDGALGCLYERGEKNAYEQISFARFNYSWLTGK